MLKKILSRLGVRKLIFFLQEKFSFIYLKKFKSDKKRIFYFLTPTHGNLGDQAIAYATLKFFNENFPDFEIFEIYSEDTYKFIKSIKKVIEKHDFIVLHGGGNMGDLYPLEEKKRRFIVSQFPENKIVSMTQTMNFSDSDKGKNELLLSKKIYNEHGNLLIIAREKVSYLKMKEEFSNVKIILNPDIVFYLINQYNSNYRNLVTTCLRNDKESVLGSQKYSYISRLKSDFKFVNITDTLIPRSVSKDERVEILNEKFSEFLNSKIIITDRLHGMVFSIITGTPALVTKSLDHKVPGTYQWVKDVNFIKLIDELNYDKNVVNELIMINELDNLDYLLDYFSNLKKILVNFLCN